MDPSFWHQAKPFCSCLSAGMGCHANKKNSKIKHEKELMPLHTCLLAFLVWSDGHILSLWHLSYSQDNNIFSILGKSAEPPTHLLEGPTVCQGVCISLNKSAFTLLQLPLEFLLAGRSGMWPFSHTLFSCKKIIFSGYRKLTGSN